MSMDTRYNGYHSSIQSNLHMAIKSHETIHIIIYIKSKIILGKAVMTATEGKL